MTPAIDGRWLDTWPLWGIGLALIAVFFVAAELGYIIYRKRLASSERQQRQ